eukprot:835398_1
MSQWICTACTYINHPVLHKCEMCDSYRKSKPMSSIDSDLELAKRLQEQFDREMGVTEPIQTKDKLNGDLSIFDKDGNECVSSDYTKCDAMQRLITSSKYKSMLTT